MLKLLNVETKKAQGFIWAYQHSEYGDIRQAYSNPSRDKIASFENIRIRCYHDNGTGLRVISHGCQYYSTGYIVGNDLIIDTYANTYFIKDGALYI